ncbi:conserved hypothetical protein [Candidatus Protochlamydia naegleriophila]|uniref:Uncharacterized protein n=1 Tax=Candidatus Protochlamydia naegleriophila TaxID=389348 RepID=A0A0U5JBH0_9BACT|nr:hypothetical protein [Candidatus Protochlamydia naegleriophila]CUI16034.1 conserved hypothetical protein [Candidatus Protochlamydia naegleriophila]
MFDYQLFLAFPSTSSYQVALAQVADPIRSLFIQNCDGEYLQEIVHQGQVYLGKQMGVCVDLAKLESLHMHIYSLLKRLVADYDYKGHPLVVLAIPLSV